MFGQLVFVTGAMDQTIHSVLNPIYDRTANIRPKDSHPCRHALEDGIRKRIWNR